jgi:hypothetical protein
VRAVGVSFLGAAALVGVVSLGVWGVGFLDTEPAVSPSPGPAVSVSPDPDRSVSPSPVERVFVERPVTVMPGALPSAEPLTEQVLEQAGAGWTALTYNASISVDGEPTSTGPYVIYLVSPDGVRYEAGVSDTEADVAGWAREASSVLVVGNDSERVPPRVLDLYTGTFTEVDQECTDGEYVPFGASFGIDGWIVRAMCGEEPRDALIAFSGKGTVDVDGLVPSEFGRSVIDVRGMQIVYEFERAPEDKFWAQRLGSEGRFPLQLPPSHDDCYPLGPADGNGAGVVCMDGAGPTVWKLNPDTDVPTPIMDDAKRVQVASALGHPDEHASIEIQHLCFAGSVPVAVIGGLERSMAVRLDTAEIVGDSQGTVEACASGSESTVILSAYGTAWSVDVVTGQSTVLAEPPARDDGNFVVGADALHITTLE